MATLRDEAAFILENAEPTVEILSPTSAEVCRGEPVELRARTFDADPGDTSAVEWRFGGRPIAVEASAEATFSRAGRLEVSVVDTHGARSMAHVDLTTVPCGSLPDLTVSWPSSDGRPQSGEDFNYRWDDSDTEGHYVDIFPTASAFDTEDGDLSGDAIRWTTDRTELQPALLGTGTRPRIRLRGSCFGSRHTITVTVTDASGNERRRVFVILGWTLC